MGKKYPAIGQITTKSRNKGLCVLCGEPKSDSEIHVECNTFRGDDDVYNAHKICIKKNKGYLLEAIGEATK